MQIRRRLTLTDTSHQDIQQSLQVHLHDPKVIRIQLDQLPKSRDERCR